MDAIDIVTDGFTRIADELPTALEGLTTEQLLWQPSPQANPMAWLAWHIGRCEDAQVAAIANRSEVWFDADWISRFGLPYGATNIGYGQTIDDVRAFRLNDSSLLSDYYAMVHQRTLEVLSLLSEDDLNQLIPNDPYQASVGVRLVSIVNDITQHLGQISYIRGLIESR